MEDYEILDKEYEHLNKWVNDQIKDLSLIKEKLLVFKNNMILLNEEIDKLKKIPNGYFGFLNQILKDFVKNISDNLYQFDDLIITPLDNFLYSFQFATSKNINILKDIKKELTEEKQELKNKRDIYFNYAINAKEENQDKSKKGIFSKFFGSEEDASKKKDKNIFNKMVGDNLALQYQYQLDKMNESIDENNLKYNNIYNEINAIFASFNLTVKESLKKFCKHLSGISSNFNTLSKEILNKMNSLKALKNEEVMQSMNKITNAKNEKRFPKEVLEKIETNNAHKKNSKKNLFNFFSKDNNNINNNELNINISEEIKEENKLNIERISNKIVSKETLKYKDVVELFNILSINDEYSYPTQFLNKIKLYYNNRVILLPNKNNFIHLSNIMNHLAIKYKTNYSILNLVLEISKKIKFQNSYLYKMMRKKNEFFGTKTFWLELIENNLINDIDKHLNNLLEKKSEEINTNNNISEEKEEDSEKNFLQKKIMNFKKLNKPQKKDIIIYAKKEISFILSKTIGQMCDFQIDEIIISEILRNFDDIFKFDYNMKYYFKMKMIVIKNMKLKNQKKYFSNKEQILNNKLILISNTSKYFQAKTYPTFFKLNKELYPKLRKKIFLNLFSDFNLEISAHIKLWHQILEIKKIKSKYNYEKIKKEVANKNIKNIDNIFVIEKDIERTNFIRNNKSHSNKIKNILACFVHIFPEIGYCQGMNYLVSFLYQLLNLEEELTFYFLCGLLLNTKYNQLFKDDFQTLNLFFKIFEKILEINRPEIYYKFIDNNIVTSSYISPLIITLFTDHAPTFKKDSPPKFIFFIIEKFILEGWSALFNCGFTLLEFTYDKIMLLEKDHLTSFVINISSVITKDENFEKTQNIFNKNSYFIDEFFVEKLIEITKMEKNNNYLDENIIY